MKFGPMLAAIVTGRFYAANVFYYVSDGWWSRRRGDLRQKRGLRDGRSPRGEGVCGITMLRRGKQCRFGASRPMQRLSVPIRDRAPKGWY